MIPHRFNQLGLNSVSPLTFTAVQAGSTVKLNVVGTLTLSTIEYNVGGGWLPYTINTLISLTNIGDKVKFRNTTNSLSTGTSNYAKFEMTGQINASGNCMSMLNNVKVCPNLCFANLFNGCTSLITPPEILCKTLGSSCFYQMFRGCSNLIRVPKLYAKTATHTCYNNMFFGCTSLTTIPEDLLPATTLNTSCYYGMFQGCTSLTNVCNLPATALANYCYYSMFENCQSLTTIPANLLSAADTLTDGCYRQMFRECSNLTNVPNLPATNLAPNCYRAMFGGTNGTKITYIPENLLQETALQESCYQFMFQNCKSLLNSCNLPATTLVTNCYNSMFSGCSSLTTCGTISATSCGNGSCRGMFEKCSSLIIHPDLNFTSVGEKGCMFMFLNCTSLLTPPQLNATSLGINCYTQMFNGCTSLTTSPELPALTVPNRAYYQMFLNCSSIASMSSMSAVHLGTEACYQMFNGCTELTGSITIYATILSEDCFRGAFARTKITSATLLATTLANRCYWYIFQNCQYLTSIRVNFTAWSNESAADHTNGWCTYSQSTPFSSTGTFYKPASLSEEYGVSRIPSGWTVVNERA